MTIFHTQFRSLLAAVLLLTSMLLGCGGPSPTDTVQSAPAETSTTTVLISPLEEPLTTPEAVLIDPGAAPVLTGTPDPDRTPVTIAQAQISPDREVITIQNISDQDQAIGGWVLFNLEAAPLFQFPEDLILKPGDSVQVFSAVAEEDVPEDAFFWTSDKIWPRFPANVLLLNKTTRLMYWFVAYE